MPGCTLAVPMPERSEVDVRVWPNPTSSSLQLTVNNVQLTDNYSYKITDLSGRILMQGKINSEKEEINISGFAAGMYFLEVRSSDGVIQTVKVVKE